MATMTGDERRARLAAARLYFICGPAPGGRALADVLGGALAGGVDVFQLRDKNGTDEELLAAAAVARDLCTQAGALFVLNDRPDLAAATGADGLHVGQEDMPVARAREAVGADRLVGLSTHTPRQIDDARGGDADYIGVGPIHATPTKPGRPAVGLELVRHAAGHAGQPWFAIGGLTEANAASAIDAGARRIAVVRAIADAPDPASAAYRLSEMLAAVPIQVHGPSQP